MRRVLGAVLLATAAAVGGGLGAPVPAGAQPVDPTGDYTPVTPARILDTRSGLGQSGPGAVGHAQTIEVQVSGRGGVPATGVSAVVLNVTAVSPTANTFLTVFPTGGSRPNISNVNVPQGAVVPNMATVALGSGGRLSVYNAVGSTHVLFDVVGFYADGTGPAGSRFTSVDPHRRFDTRNGTGGVAASPIGPGGTLSVDMSAAGSPVPGTGVTAVVLNVTVTAPTANGFLRVAPAGTTSTTSSLNFRPGQTVPNLVTVPVPASGVVDFFNPAGTTHVIADIVGYYGPADGEAGRFIGIVPERFFDTRASGSLGPLPGGLADSLNLAGGGGVPDGSIGAAVLNVTATQPTAAGFLTVFNDDLCEVPTASNLNFVAGQTVANQVITGLSVPGNPFTCSPFPELAPAAAIYNAVGETHYVVDVFGYFTNASGIGAAAASREATSATSDTGADRAPRP